MTAHQVAESKLYRTAFITIQGLDTVTTHIWSLMVQIMLPLLFVTLSVTFFVCVHITFSTTTHVRSWMFTTTAIHPWRRNEFSHEGGAPRTR